MGVDVLLDAIREGEFDPACARIETALRAIWLLYRRDKWDLLEATGLPRETFLPAFQTFDARHEVGKHLRTDRNTLEFLRDIRSQDTRLAIGLLSAAVWMIGQYMTHKRRLMAAWYGHDEWSD